MITQLLNIVENFRAHLVYRRKVLDTIKELNRLSNRELNDIGLSRGDIRYIAYSEPRPDRKPVNDMSAVNSNIRGWV